MSVDYTAKIVYGWLIDDYRMHEYCEMCDKEERDYSDYIHRIDGWSGDKTSVFGIEVNRTDHICFIESDMIDPAVWDDDEDWVACWHEFYHDFPDVYDNLKPGFFLVLQTW